MMNSARVNIIVAITPDNAIGRDGDLLYRLKPDMRHFKEITMGHPIVMGRKTWQSLPKGALPGRRNIVISRNKSFEAPGAEVYGDLLSALSVVPSDEDLFIIGGAQIYAAALPLADKLYLTVIDAPSDGADTFFPEINIDEWVAEDVSEWQDDEESGVRYRFVCLSRK